MATASVNQTVRDHPWLVRKVHITTWTSGSAVSVTHGGPANMNPDDMTWSVTKQCSTPCAFVVTRVLASDSASAGTCSIIADAETGGSLTGMELDLFFHFYSTRSGGIT